MSGRVGPASLRVLLVVVILWIGPLVVFLMLRSDPNELPSSDSSAARVHYVDVGRRTLDVSVEVQAVVERSPDLVVAANRGGVLTSVAPGGPANGDVLATIDGRPVVAHVGRYPFFRDLVQGSRGPDVRELNEMFAQLGVVRGAPSGRFDAATLEALHRAQDEWRLPRSDTFSFRDTLYVGSRSEPSLSWAAQVGSTLTAGQPLITVRGRALHVTIAGDADLGGLQTVAGPDGLQLLVGTQVVDIPGVPIPKRSADRVADLWDSAQATGTPMLLSPKTPRSFGAVPGSAVLSDKDQASCVYPRRLGRVLLPPDLPPSDEIGIALVPLDLVGESVVADVMALPPSERTSC